MAPAEGTSVPANLPAVVIQPGVDPTGRHAPELLSADGAVLPSTAELVDFRWVVTPDAPLEPEASYTVRSWGLCDLDATESTATFVTTAPAPVPTSLGTLSVEREERGEVITPGGALCEQAVEGAAVTLTFEPDETVQPWLPVVRWRLFVNGGLWRETLHGRMDRQHLTQRELLRVFKVCDGGGQDDGPQTVELQGFLPGGSEPFATTTAQISLECPRPFGCASAGPAPLVPVALVAAGLLFRLRAARSGRCTSSAGRTP